MVTGIVLAAGSGKRIGGDIPKQFLTVGGEPLIARTLRAFERCGDVDEVLLVTSPGWLRFCRENVVQALGLTKVRDVVEGGAERFDSVYRALLMCRESEIVAIHDGARPFVTEEIISRTVAAARAYGAAAAGMPSKDTVKIADADGFVSETPDRRRVWNIQTPQTFRAPLILRAHEQLRAEGRMDGVTDDAMMVERSGLAKVKLVEGSYENVKITTPDDLALLKTSAPWTK